MIPSYDDEAGSLFVPIRDNDDRVKQGAGSMLQLASKSPRRCELLRQIGVQFKVIHVDIDEAKRPDETARAYVDRLAIAKAQAGFENSPRHTTLGSDTIVVCDDGVLGKPRHFDDAKQMLLMLSGRSHQVYTGVAVTDGIKVRSRVVTSTVTFTHLSIGDIHRYWATGEPIDKAGSYGIQGYGAIFVVRLEGSYSNVVGLPLSETAELLADFAIPVWQVLTEKESN